MGDQRPQVFGTPKYVKCTTACVNHFITTTPQMGLSWECWADDMQDTKYVTY
jgi:hypothetical protein